MLIQNILFNYNVRMDTKKSITLINILPSDKNGCVFDYQLELN